MNVYLRALLSLLLLPAVDASAEVKDLSPPPLNPRPKEALHVSVTFDRPEDAKRYAIIMKALYQNQQGECGYIEPGWNQRFVYPEGTFEIPNKSSDPRRAKFDIYLDRYKSDTCNWELAKPYIRILDRHSGKIAGGTWGIDEDLVPGTKFKITCPFRDSEHSLTCFDRGRPVPDTHFYKSVPFSGRIPVTVYVSKDSVSLHPDPPSYFSNFIKTVTPSDEAKPLLQKGND